MKNYRTLAMLALAGTVSLGFARPLSPQEALNRIAGSGAARKIRATENSLSLKYTMSAGDAKEASLYVFDTQNSDGFIVLSADDAAFPVLGYSDHGSFDPANIPPQLDYWLREYSNQIQAMRNGNLISKGSASAVPFADMEAVAPLLKSKWNQGAPYNEYCYTIAADGTETKSVTGCVATSMAQVMYYFQYPAVGTGSISYKHGDSGTYTMNFGEQDFNWKDMLPTYYPGSYNAEQADAVAYLMKACGYSVRMDYGKGESGASGTAISGALIEYFGYNSAIQVQTRAFHTYSDWASMIYDNLKNVGPVVYNGSALDGGHSFVCDGYDGNGYFHFNWGWGGMSDGYYLLDALNPDEFGIGGAAGGYNLGQQIILNISPKEVAAATPQLMQFGTAEGTVADGALSIELKDASDAGFQYIDPPPVKVTFGLKVVNVSDPSQEVQYFQSAKKDLEARQGNSFHWDEVGTKLELNNVKMTEGDDYQVILSTLITGASTSAWSETVAMPGKANYVTVIKTADGYQVKNQSVGNISVSDFSIESSPVYFNLPVEFKAVFANDASQPLTRNYSAVFFDASGKECYKMENYSVNVDAGATLTDTWTSVNWYKENGAADVTEATEYTVKLYDNWQGEYVDGIELTVTVEPEKKEGKVESSLTIVGATKDGDIYEIKGNELSVSLEVKVLEGSYNHTIMLAIQAPMADGEYMTVMHKHFDAIPNLSAGEEQVFDMSVVFDDAEPGKTYRVEVWGEGSGFNEKALVKFNLQNSGIASIVPDAAGEYVVYGLDGVLRARGNSLEILDALPHGIYIVNGVKIIREVR